ncbi:ABC-type transport auxiliary lipoprotein family protein [Rhodobaculum claviforme]|uniref:ABC-type transport auxiliary lipoprotein component domain-containing protein n=1 Tax=Rhodobaculum claviforme TaxID=1549854 RepID=A0A934WIH8_9RHOB|nr:ABC-type transport auxiliary lipoprotein family protein [Rhodobaculum claviforme]MBK5926909.1 hypothetical protein [Rhodobaculum claviforme]
MTLPRPALPFMLLAALSLAGCGGLLGSSPALDAYELRAPAQAPAAARSLARDVVVEVPEAGPAIAIDRILIRPNPVQAQYLPGARWIGDAPVMVQGMLVRTLQDANAFRYVGRRPLGPGADFALVSELTDFQAEQVADGTRVRVRLSVQLVREQDAAVIASRTFQTTAPVDSLATLDVVRGFNAASDTVLREVSAWVLGRLGAGVAG